MASTPQPPPSALMRHVNPLAMSRPDATKRSLAWDASYAHPKVAVDEDSLPKMFQTGS